jgi:hypothetical protein
MCRHRPLPLEISPRNDDVEFLMSKTGGETAGIFIMNHGKEAWSGDIILDRVAAGLSPGVGENARVILGTGYRLQETTPKLAISGDKLMISGIRLSGDTDRFCSYRQASFACIKLGKRETRKPNRIKE